MAERTYLERMEAIQTSPWWEYHKARFEAGEITQEELKKKLDDALEAPIPNPQGGR